jgi:hypothetical protein
MSTEEVFDQVEAPIAEIVAIKRNYGTIAALVVGGAAVGAGLTYFLTKKKLAKHYEDKFDLELEESMKFLVAQMGLDKVIVSNDDPDEVVGQPGEGDFDDDVADPTLAEVPTPVVEDLEPLDGVRTFPGQDDKTPLEDLAARNQKTQYNTPVPSSLTDDKVVEVTPEEEPYNDPDISVISRDVFYANGTEWPQETLTYFADAGVLDVGGDWVVEPESQIGGQKPPFGQMSEDPNVVYLKNKRLKKEFEVIFDSGNASDFANATDGDDDELKHSIQSLAAQYRPEYER